ncbi:hypothetical protein JCM10207_007511 [Rhodosporidiobolus poonsookiae]
MAEPPPSSATTPSALSRKRPRTSPPPAVRAMPAPPPIAVPSAPASVEPSSSTAPQAAPSMSNESLGTHPVRPPAHYTSLAASNPSSAAFQLPLHLTAFSYSPTRELLFDAERKNEAMAVYREPRMGSDLNFGFEQATWRDGSVDEGLDALLDTLSEFAKTDANPPAATDLLGKTSLVTWRGMLTKLMLAVYEAENVAQGRRGDGWEMNAMLVDGCLYLEESNPPSKLAKKSASESSYLIQSYYGYSFEAYSTQPFPSSSSSSHASAAPPPAFEPPNTNVQWCSIVKTSLGGFRTIVGGEVDCVRPGADKDRIATRDFVELKTNMVIQSQRDEVNFERLKLLKHYVQSFLLGVPRVTVGFRTRQGQLTGIQHFATLDIPRLVRGKPHAWDSQACLASAQDLITFIHRTLSNHPSTQSAEAAFASPAPPASSSGPSSSGDPSPALPSFPVFRLSFTPSPSALGPAGLSVRELTPEEVEGEVCGAKRTERRVGFLLERWVREVRERRREINERMSYAPPPAPAVPYIPPTASAGRRVPPPPPPPLSTAAGGPPGGSVAAGLKR